MHLLMYIEKMNTTRSAPMRTTMMMAMLGLNLLLLPNVGGGAADVPLVELILEKSLWVLAGHSCNYRLRNLLGLEDINFTSRGTIVRPARFGMAAPRRPQRCPRSHSPQRSRHCFARLTTSNLMAENLVLTWLEPVPPLDSVSAT